MRHTTMLMTRNDGNDAGNKSNGNNHISSQNENTAWKVGSNN